MISTSFFWRAGAMAAALGLCASCGEDPDRDPGSGANLDPYDAERQACVDRINGFRATEGLAPYERWQGAELCSDEEAESDSITQTAHGAFGQCNEQAQNECPGWPSIDNVIQGCLQAMWDEGPGEPFSEHGHYINMSSESYTKVACGFFVTDGGSVWAIQNFAP
ncbi:MAG: hypothetical protein JRI23_36705 [Deltaproteobacteria bacterium]|jgi:hypothetical protein|nr:hypothetical protein [Deltaproteobacteria bacterium]MBW2537911.1 hypothetical protein [Deltaproteobacteria bacterium]